MKGKNMDALISIIVPIHNTELYLEQCIQSILYQTYKQIEIILLNDIRDGDCKKNRCRKICRKYQKQYKDKISFYERNFAGPSEARNFGIQEAKGDYICFLDSDDCCEPTMLEKLYSTMLKTKSDVVICGYVEHKTNKMKKFLYGENLIINDKDFFISLLEGEKLGNYVWNKLYKKEIWRGINFPKGEIFEDISTVYKVIMNSNKIAVINEPLYHYLRRDDSTSNLIDYTILKQQYCAIRRRNKDIIAKYPDLYEKAMGNELKYNIVIWNQLCKKYSWKELLELMSGEFPDLLKEIREGKKKKYFSKLELKYKIMGFCLWSWVY